MNPPNMAAALEAGVIANPFPGLRSFEFEESHLYFGRDGQSEQLITRLGRARFVAVVGTSGSGKSSLVRAGLLPALLGGFMSGEHADWRIAVMRPGNDPIGNLARSLNSPGALAATYNGDASIHTAGMEATLRRGSLGLVDVFRQLRGQGNESLLVVVDQFEEIFRLARVSADEAYQNQAAAFVKLFLEASHQRDLPIYVVLTMRSDYLGDCSQFWGLPEAVNESQYLIPRLTRDQLREAITGPVAVGGGAITPRLVTRLLNDVGDSQDQLPILQHALMRTWNKWKETRARGPIDLEEYEAIGGMASALSLHADEAFTDLSQQGEEAAEKLFKALTEKGPDNREIRRPITLAEACAVSGKTEAEIESVIETFRQPGRSFLMPPADVPLHSESLLDISHESLIRGWQRLKAWVEEEGESARIYRRLAQTAELHRKGQAGLWGDPDLPLALDWREKNKPNEQWARRYHPEFAGAMDFLESSRQQRDREAIQKQQQQRKIRRMTISLFLISGLAVVVGGGLFFWAKHESAIALRKAEVAVVQAGNVEAWAREQEEEARSKLDYADRQLEEAAKRISKEDKQMVAEQSLAEANQNQALALRVALQANDKSDPFISGILAIESLEISDSFEGRRALATAFRLSPPAPEILRTGSPEPITVVAFSRDNRRMAWGAPSGQVVIWDLVKQAKEKVFETHQMPFTLAFSADARWLAAGTAGTLWLWDVTLADPSPDQIQPVGNIKSVAFSPNGEYVAIAGGLLRLFQNASGRWEEVKLPAKPELPAVEAVVFLDNSTVAIAGTHGLSFLTIPSFSLSINTKLEGACKSVALSGDSHWLAAACDTEILVTDFGERDAGIPITTFRPNLISISSDGKYFAAKNYQYAAIYVYNNASHQEIFQELLPVFSGIPSSSFVFRPDGQILVAGLQDGSIAQWNDLTRGALALRWTSRVLISGMAFSPDKEWLATTSPEEGVVRIVRTSDIQNPPSVPPLPVGPGVRNPVFSSNGRYLAVTDDNGACLIQMKTRKLLSCFPAGAKAQAAFTHDGQFLLVFDSGQIRRFETGNLAEVMPVIGERFSEELIYGGSEYKLSPDGNFLVAKSRVRHLSAHVFQTITRVWSLRTGLELPSSKTGAHDTSDTHANPLVEDSGHWQSVFQRPLDKTDGKWKITLSPGSVTDLDLIDIGTHRTVAVLDHDDSVLDVAFSPDGRWLLTASEDKTVRLWPLQVEDLIKQACKLLPRNLTAAEWKALELQHPYHETCKVP